MRVMVIFYKEQTGWWYGPYDLETLSETTKEYDYVLPVVFPCEKREWAETITNILETAALKPKKIKHYWVDSHHPERGIHHGFLIHDSTPTRPFDPKLDSIERLQEAILGIR